MSMSESAKPICPVILSGGAGTRLWPMSRAEKPKQFLSLTQEQSMFHMTLARTQGHAQFGSPIIVANAAHSKLIEAELKAMGAESAHILLEPYGRNTAPAIALAALAVDDPQTPLLVMPSDHIISDVAAFHSAIDAGLRFAEQGWLVTFGIEASYAETGYGYIKAGQKLSENVVAVERFIEKPDLHNAEKMVAAGGHYWNGGIFLFRADIFLNALAEHAPDILSAAKAAMAAADVDGLKISPDAAAFAASPSISIDYAVMEKSDQVAAVPVAMGWSDVGSWDALYDIGAKDDAGNNLNGPIQAIESSGNLIRSDGMKINIVGIDNLIIVASDNEILILPRGKSQEVKKIKQ